MQDTLVSPDTLPLSIYIHYPWCEKKCPYCDFNSYDASKTQPAYLDALIADCTLQSQTTTREIQSIFIGGGTPSLMPLTELEKLMSTLNNVYQFAADIEITIEVNPASALQEKFAVYKELGINRVSLGVQSFNDYFLQFLGRVHCANTARQAITYAKQYFDIVNIDLIFGLATQTTTQVIEDIKMALQYEPTHLSFYQLTIEPHTYFAKYPPVLPTDDICYEMMHKGIERIEQAGLLRYEVSAYGQPAKHNMNYWLFGDYLGIGAGAHGKITYATNIIRTHQHYNPQDYINSYRYKQHTITNRAFDFMLNALRLKDGFNTELFTARTGLPIFAIQPQLDTLLTKELITYTKNIIKPTELGYNHLNSLQEIFL